MAEIPSDKIVDLVKRGESDVDGVGDVFAVKDAAVDIAFGEDGDLLDKLKLFERFNKIEVAAAVRFGHAFELTLNEDRTACTVFRHLVLPPADGHIAAERFAVIEIGTDNGCFQVKTELHKI